MENMAKETRKQNRLEKLGINNPVCSICGENDWRCLEEHHIAGRAYDDDTATICRNCHRKLSDDQKDHPQKLENNPSKMESIGHLLLGLADLFTSIVEKLRECGEFLISSAREMVVA